jgi:thiamine biosynthesis lipoprotein
VLSEALEFARRFPGCFDVTIAPLVALWHTARQSFSQPDASSVQQILPLVNYRDLVLEPRDMTAGLRAVGQSLDLGGIGKGFAGDKILEIFGRFGVTSAYSNLGGNVVTLGAKLDGSPWHIGIQHPRQEQRLIGVVSVADQTVVTSGDYQRYYTDRQGKRHHHILDPRTGYPAESGLISVSVVTEKSLVADVLSTVVFIAGLEKGLECLRNFPQTEAILVDTELQIHVTQGLKHRFQADQGVDVIILN